MAVLLIDGFDKYGPSSVNTAAVAAALAGKWTTVTNTPTSSAELYISTGLSSTGQSLNMTTVQSSVLCSVAKTLSATASRLVGGVRFQILNSYGVAAIIFSDGSSAQCSITINQAGTGTFILRSGGTSGTIIATSTASITTNSIHFLEWDITFGTSGAYTLYLDGIAILTGTGNTRAGTTNNYAGVFTLGALSSSGGTTTQVLYDDLYLFDTTTAVNNAVLLTNPRIETQLPISDATVQFAPTTNLLGAAYATVTITSAPGANELFLRAFTPAVNMTLNSVSCLPGATSAGANFKAVLYSDSSGAPHTLIATGAQVTGTTSGTLLTSAFGSGQSLTATTQYWIGFITDTSVVLTQVDATTTGQKAANTYTSGAPSTAPTMTAAQPSWLIYGNCSSAAHNYVAENVNPPAGLLSYVADSTVGNYDLYNFPSLSVASGTIYVVGVEAYAADLASGVRTINLEMVSSSTTGNGDQTGISPGLTFAWLNSHFDTDPNTGSAWTVSALNAATAGLIIAT